MTNDELLTRGVEETVPKELAQEKLKSGKKLRVYMGIDPTGAKLHLGHSVPLRKLKAFAEAGHDVIFLIGSYTAMIGDPTGRDTMREPLTKDQVEKNFESYKQQASKILDFKKVQIRFNDEWLSTLTGSELLTIAGNFSMQQILQREMFQQRMKKGEDLNSKEFFYPVLQGYDSVILDVDCEVGGNDQLFNMLCGRKLQKAYGKRDKFVLTTKLIEGTDGRKMSKTYDNCIYLTDAPNDMYGKVMSIKDDLMTTYFECCTDVAMEEAKKILKGNPRDAKARLAREIVSLYHGEQAANEAEAEFLNVFSKGQTPDDIPEVKMKKGEALVDLLAREGIASSKTEARTLIKQHAVSIDGEAVIAIDVEARVGVVKVGKRKFVRIR